MENYDHDNEIFALPDGTCDAIIETNSINSWSNIFENSELDVDNGLGHLQNIESDCENNPTWKGSADAGP